MRLSVRGWTSESEFTTVILDEDELKWMANEKNISLLLKQSHNINRCISPRFEEVESYFRDAKGCFDAS